MTKTWIPTTERTTSNRHVVQYLTSYTSPKYPGVTLREVITNNGVTTKTDKTYRVEGTDAVFYTVKSALEWQA
jgi:hypothetical protein